MLFLSLSGYPLFFFSFSFRCGSTWRCKVPVRCYLLWSVVCVSLTFRTGAGCVVERFYMYPDSSSGLVSSFIPTFPFSVFSIVSAYAFHIYTLTHDPWLYPLSPIALIHFSLLLLLACLLYCYAFSISIRGCCRSSSSWR